MNNCLKILINQPVVKQVRTCYGHAQTAVPVSLPQDRTCSLDEYTHRNEGLEDVWAFTPNFKNQGVESYKTVWH